MREMLRYDASTGCTQILKVFERRIRSPELELKISGSIPCNCVKLLCTDKLHPKAHGVIERTHNSILANRLTLNYFFRKQCLQL